MPPESPLGLGRVDSPSQWHVGPCRPPARGRGPIGWKLVPDRFHLADEHVVAAPADFERTFLVRCRENQTLTRCKNRHDTDRRCRHALCKGRDNMESVASNGVVSDTRHVTEVEAYGTIRTQVVGVGGFERGRGECCGNKDTTDRRSDLDNAWNFHSLTPISATRGYHDRTLGGWASGVVRRSRPIVHTGAH